MDLEKQEQMTAEGIKFSFEGKSSYCFKNYNESPNQETRETSTQEYYHAGK